MTIIKSKILYTISTNNPQDLFIEKIPRIFKIK